MSDTPNQRPLPMRTSADTDGEVSRVLGKLEASGQDLSIIRLMANSSSCFRPFVQLSNGLLNKSPLPANVREAVILDIAATEEIEYEWAEHEAVAVRSGLTPAQVDAIRAGGDLEKDLPPELILAVDTARLVRSRCRLDAARWDELVAAWGREGAMDLVLSVAWWGGFVPTVIRALGLTAADLGPGAII